MAPWFAVRMALSKCGGAKASVWVPSQRLLAPDITSVGKCESYNEMKPGLCKDLLAFTIRLRKSPKTTAIWASLEVRCLQTKSIAWHIREEKEGKKEWREEDSKERPSRKLFVYCIRIIHLRFMGTKRKSYHLD